MQEDQDLESIVLGGGCFWCLEAIFQRVPGVINIQSGYAGGYTLNPNYYEVCTGQTGHAEVVKIEFDTQVITLEKVLKIFFLTHDPTTVNRQGNDIGPEYRSLILYDRNSHNQKSIIEKVIEEVQKEVTEKIVTEVKPLEKFYKAEEEQQNYYKRNSTQPYCRFVIQPKLDKVLKTIQ